MKSRRAYSTDRDVIRRQGRQILEILNSERLTAMVKVKKWITSTASTASTTHQPQQQSSITDEDMMHFQQMTKLVHFLYTPLLFLPRYVHCTGCLRWIGDILKKSYTVASYLVPDISLPIIFMVEKCVHFDIWNIKKFDKGSPYYDMIWFIFQIWIWAENLKNEPNHRGTL